MSPVLQKHVIRSLSLSYPKKDISPLRKPRSGIKWSDKLGYPSLEGYMP